MRAIVPAAFAIVLATLIAPAALAQPRSFGAPLDAVELAKLQGGFTLPNGIDVSLAVRSDTVIDGRTVLRTVYRVADTASLTVYTAKNSADGASNVALSAGPKGELILTGTGAVGGAPVTVRLGGAADDDSGAGLTEVAVAPGETVVVPGGLLSLALARQGNGGQVTLAGEGMSTTHLFGDALGSLTINRADGVALDTSTSVSLQLGDLSVPQIDAAALATDALASDAVSQLARPGGF